MTKLEEGTYVHLRERELKAETLERISSVQDGEIKFAGAWGGFVRVFTGTEEEFLDLYAVVSPELLTELLGRFDPISVNATDEDELPMHGYSNGELWNGWQVPWFTLDEIRRAVSEGILGSDSFKDYAKFLYDEETGRLYEITDGENRGFDDFDDAALLAELKEVDSEDLWEYGQARGVEICDARSRVIQTPESDEPKMVFQIGNGWCWIKAMPEHWKHPDSPMAFDA